MGEFKELPEEPKEIVGARSKDSVGARQLRSSMCNTTPMFNESAPDPIPSEELPGPDLGVLKAPVKRMIAVVINKTAKELGFGDPNNHSIATRPEEKNQPAKEKDMSKATPEDQPATSSSIDLKRARSNSMYDDTEERQPKMMKLCAAYALMAAMLDKDQIHGVKNRVPTPKDYDAAVNDPLYGAVWREAVQAEINALMANGTWEEVRKPDGINMVTSKWVFTVKYAPNGSVERYKARLVARGFTQIYGLDYTATFAPTMRIDSLRLLLALMALEDMEAEQVDVNNAFTESELKEKIYMLAPNGLSIKSGRVLLLLKSLYGLKQSAREWNQKCDRALVKLEFKRTSSDPCVYYREADGAIVGVYVDDLLILAPQGKQSVIDNVKAGLRSMFKIKELGKVERILGIRITRIRNERTVYLDQIAYIEKFLHEFAMEHEKAKPTSIPVNGYDHMRKTTIDDEPGDRNAYCRKVGSIMFAMVYSRPDICFALSKLSQYISAPGAHHEVAVKQVLRYLRSTSTLRLCYGPTRSFGKQEYVTVYADSDHAADRDDRRSVLGYTVMIGGGAISWVSRRQKSVSTSTAEAEYMALAQASKQALWIRQLLWDIDRLAYLHDRYTVKIYEDN